MNRNYYGLGAIIAFVTVGILILKIVNSPNTKQLQHIARTPTPLPKEYTVTLDKNGFSPKEVTVKVGNAVRWENVTNKPQTVNSDDYPTNQLHKELNFGIFNSGSSVIYTFTKAGTYGYHNQFHPEQKGIIIVQK